MQRIYLDYAATTPTDREILEKMYPYFTDYFDNPSALYSQKIKYDLENARKQVASALLAKPSEIVFTSGGTEANNLAVLGVGRQFPSGHFITTQIEHDSVLKSFEQLEKEGKQVTYLPVDSFGRISIEELQAAIRPETRLVSVMAANNEIGTIQDIPTISQICKEKAVLFHTDAVQAIGHVPISAEQADFITLSAHKLYAPKGVGALYVRKGLRLQPLIFGGHQESNRRGGTENITGIIAFGMAVEKQMQEKDIRNQHLRGLEHFLQRELAAIGGIRHNGHPTERVAGIYHISIEDVSTEALLTLLDMNQISISSGSACQAGSYQISHVMKALKEKSENGHLRISLGKDTREEELVIFLEKLKQIIGKLRK